MSFNRAAVCLIPAAQVRLNAQPVLITDEVPTAQSEVEVERVGDRITGLRVRCACGRVIVAECEYDSIA